MSFMKEVIIFEECVWGWGGLGSTVFISKLSHAVYEYWMQLKRFVYENVLINAKEEVR